MKAKYSLLLFSIILCIQIISVSGTADENNYLLTLIDKDSSISRITAHPSGDIVYFNISITLQNSGTIVSDNITVQIEDDEGSSIKRNGTIMPGEQKTFFFNEYPLTGMHQHKINISYYPTLDTIKRTTNNQGTDTYILLPSTEKPSTPGFEFCFFTLSLIVLISYIQHKKKTRKK